MKKEFGLTENEVLEQRKKHGSNVFVVTKKENIFTKIFKVVKEPMFLLLIAASLIYFFLGEPNDGIIMLISVTLIISIEIYQEFKTDKTLEALKQLSSPKITVLRDKVKQEISSDELVPNDIMYLVEGAKVPADGYILKCSGLCVDESILTGESEGVWKNEYSLDKEDSAYYKKTYCYAGTLVVQGTATIQVTETGFNTEYGKIGVRVLSSKEEISPLQKQVNFLVKICATIAFILFILVSIITFLNLSSYQLNERITASLLSGITLAMSLIPEELPVILTVFLSMGAWRLAKKNSIVKRLSSVETLGSISVLCVDKTGTITQNEMKVEKIWSDNIDNKELSEVMGLCCAEETYDPMEKAMLQYCNYLDISNNHLFAGEKIKEYAFTNDLKMMGYLWKHDDMNILAVKGSSESVLDICKLSDSRRNIIEEEIKKMSLLGLRVISVARKIYEDDFEIKEKLTDNELEFCGLIGLIDPPRLGVEDDIEACYKAGIKVVMITGDNGFTASSISKKIGIKNYDNIITGTMIDEMSDIKLKEQVNKVSIFSRVTPEHKMRIVKAFKENGEIVAMTGDGVNDAPALKYADIGISMGKRGSDISKEASDLIILDDNFNTIVDTIRDGRRIYANIKKAVSYIFVIHVPIALSSLIGPILSIEPSNLLLLPVHIVLLELIIDPTCSVILERQQLEKNAMSKKPRKSNEKLINSKILFRSLLQGFIIFLSSFSVYLSSHFLNILTYEKGRTMGLLIIILANLFIVVENSYESELMITSFKKVIKDKVMRLIFIVTFIMITVLIYTPLSTYFKLTALNLKELFIVIILAFISVFWYEIVKIFKLIKNK